MPADLKLFTDLKDACIELVAVLPKLNDSQRKEMRDILLQLKGDLTDSLVLAEQYLNGVRRSTRDVDILDQLYNAPSKLIGAYNEFKICAALYHLDDRFNQWFSAIKGTVNAGNVKTVRKLIRRIADGERFVVCELEAVLRELPDYAKQYEDADQSDREAVLSNIHSYIKTSLTTIRKSETETKKAISAVVALM